MVKKSDNPRKNMEFIYDFYGKNGDIKGDFAHFKATGEVKMTLNYPKKGKSADLSLGTFKNMLKMTKKRSKSSDFC